MQHFKKHILPYVIIPLLVLAISSSYYRFMVQHDNIVSYEGYCDEATESCFVGCEEELNNQASCPLDLVYYFTEIERNASDLIKLCGDSIADCEAADYCSKSELDCSVTYCDPKFDLDELTGKTLCALETDINLLNN